MAKDRTVLRIGAYQGPTEPGALEKNAQAGVKLLAEAHRMNVDFACLPECYLSGYGSPDVLRKGAVSVRSGWFQKWVSRCRFGDMVSIVGFVERRGSLYHNSAAIIHRGKLLGVYRKSISGSKHEKKVMTYVSHFPVFRVRGVTIGVIICVEGSVPEPCLILAERGARIIFEPHYSFVPMALMDAQRVRVRNSRIARAVENQCWHVRANTVTEPQGKMGGEAGIGYGDSLILDHLGVPRAEAGLFTTGWITADAPKKNLMEKRPGRIAISVPRATRVQMARLYR